MNLINLATEMKSTSKIYYIIFSTDKNPVCKPKYESKPLYIFPAILGVNLIFF